MNPAALSEYKTLRMPKPIYENVEEKKRKAPRNTRREGLELGAVVGRP
jgi:hypothetical protein